MGLQWPVQEDGTDTQILHKETLNLEKVDLKILTGKNLQKLKIIKKNIH